MRECSDTIPPAVAATYYFRRDQNTRNKRLRRLHGHERHKRNEVDNYVYLDWWMNNNCYFLTHSWLFAGLFPPDVFADHHSPPQISMGIKQAA
jgi:hypothetical protein